jgi:signal transduction histidine kinase
VRNACESVALLVNGADTRVTVQLIGKPNGVEVVVTDHGAGIAPDILPTIFHFGTTTKGSKGNGMGLWTVKHIVNKHRGEVKVHSTPGEGTRIDLWWPRAYA